MNIIEVDDETIISLEKKMVELGVKIEVPDTINHIKYQRIYMDAAYKNVFHMNYAVYNSSHEVMGYFMLSKYISNNHYHVCTSPGYYTSLPILKSGLSRRMVEKIYFCFEKILQRLVNEGNDTTYVSPLKIGCKKYSCSLFLSAEEQYLSNRYNIYPRYKSVVDTRFTADYNWKNVRKSYRNLINRFSDKIVHRLYQEDISPETWLEFKSMHQSESGGRSLRSGATWDYQFQQIKDGKAFLITAHLVENDEYLGAAVFEMNEFECIYSNAAYKRSKFSLPVSHGVIWQAIKYCTTSSICFLDLGEYVTEIDFEKYDQKYLNISLFKKGFTEDLLKEKIFEFSV